MTPNRLQSSTVMKKAILNVDEPSDPGVNDGWEDTDDFPGQLAVDVYETADKLVVKARARLAFQVRSQRDDFRQHPDNFRHFERRGRRKYHRLAYSRVLLRGEFSRTIALPVPVKEEEGTVKAELKDGVLTISFEKNNRTLQRKSLSNSSTTSFDNKTFQVLLTH